MGSINFQSKSVRRLKNLYAVTLYGSYLASYRVQEFMIQCELLCVEELPWSMVLSICSYINTALVPGLFNL